MDTLYEIQNGMTITDGVLKLRDGWLIGRDSLVKRDRYGCWSCNCAAFENLGLCSHTVAVAATEDPHLKMIGEEYMRCWMALGTEAARLKAALKSKPTEARGQDSDMGD